MDYFGSDNRLIDASMMEGAEDLNSSRSNTGITPLPIDASIWDISTLDLIKSGKDASTRVERFGPRRVLDNPDADVRYGNVLG